jgi:hypothetical protein
MRLRLQRARTRRAHLEEGLGEGVGNSQREARVEAVTGGKQAREQKSLQTQRPRKTRPLLLVGNDPKIGEGRPRSNEMHIRKDLPK